DRNAGGEYSWHAQEGSGGFGRSEQRLHLAPHRRVTTARTIEIRRALGWRALERRMKERLDIRPPPQVHESVARGVRERSHGPSNSRRSHARAITHSRFTVAGETPRAAAVSSILRPPK